MRKRAVPAAASSAAGHRRGEKKQRLETKAREDVDIGWYSLAKIRIHNPQLDTEQGPRAYLVPGDYSRENWDSLVDSMITGIASGSKGVSWKREASDGSTLRDLRFYTADWRQSLVSHAVYAGFFPYASAFEYPGQAEIERCLLNLEVSGASREKTEMDPGGRVIMDDISKLKTGKKTVKSVKRHKYSLVCHNDSIERVLRAIVGQHGLDWMGFRRVRELLFGLPRLPGGDTFVEEKESSVRMRVVAFELRDMDNEGKLVSGEVGYIVGSCYTCLSVYSDKGYPKGDRVRTQAVILNLARSGVKLFDAGVTADYYQILYGFKKVGKHEFVAAWRKYRNVPLKSEQELLRACNQDQLYKMLSENRDAALKKR